MSGHSDAWLHAAPSVRNIPCCFAAAPGDHQLQRAQGCNSSHKSLLVGPSSRPVRQGVARWPTGLAIAPALVGSSLGHILSQCCLQSLVFRRLYCSFLANNKYIAPAIANAISCYLGAPVGAARKPGCHPAVFG